MSRTESCLAYSSKIAVEIPNYFAGNRMGYQCPNCERVFSSTCITVTVQGGCQFDSDSD